MKETPHLLQQKAVICGFAPNGGGGEGGICRRMKEMPHLLQQMAVFCDSAPNASLTQNEKDELSLVLCLAEDMGLTQIAARSAGLRLLIQSAGRPNPAIALRSGW